MKTFDHPTAAAEFVADDAHAHWHDQALWFIRAKRDKASQTLPEWEVLRERAAAIKQHTISHLGDYLEEFERNATRLGAVVHWARDAAEHNAIVHGLLRERGVRRMVKSKSMLTEECGLNPYLEQQGIEVTDTDLGEWIVQLRREHPSHIVLPAIHIKKEEVGELFHRELGTDEGATDPTYLTEAARHRLREKFLQAEAGLTGVNFGIAETGGFVVCTNEGNSDLGTSLPKLHIASMGIEKLVPRLDDLGVFLRLLARSATGQPITAYSTHYHGPRPGCELHIVLVDNGRTKLLASDDFRNSLRCIRCGACLNTCPVYRRSGGHSYAASVAGPIGSIVNPSRDAAKYHTLPFACTLCGSCGDVCPVKIDLPNQLLTWRQRIAELGLLEPSKRRLMGVAGKLLSSPRLYAFAGSAGRTVLRWAPRWLLYNRFNPWGRQRELPTPPDESFRQWHARRGRGGKS
ncbi:lactate utilization protein B [Lacipirellula parvula]|uniref:Putative L-lactate dehydrogenase n=1 Tax=Lacipirellula parvula TaxID=2650471 RepID=A0A5K7X631_9BACT|nr:lactate utilization protein B [Lacipirellula parvula]BBO32020.1 putative L-lactate dehydrogenase [Lacipirellula parvula]